jgi:hypothetical protein
VSVEGAGQLTGVGVGVGVGVAKWKPSGTDDKTFIFTDLITLVISL